MLALAGVVGYHFLPTSPQSEWRAGQEALRAGDWRRAETHAAGLDRHDRPDAARQLRGAAWLGRARVQAESGLDPRGALRSALAEFSRVRSADAVPEATARAAECLIRLGERPLALTALRAILTDHPDLAEAHRWAAAVYVDLNSPLAAAHHLAEWGRLDPSTGRPFRWAGFFHKSAGKPAQAVEAYRTALARPLDDDLRSAAALELAEVLLDDLGDHRGALEALEQVPAAGRDQPQVKVQRAATLWRLGRRDEAARLADEALVAAPDLPAALLLRGGFHLDADAPAAARPLLERAAQLTPHDLAVLTKLASACDQLGDREAAATHRLALDRTTALRGRMTRLHAEAEQRPWDPAPRREAAQVCRDLRRPEEALMWARAAFACDPTDRANRELLAALGDPGPRPADKSTPSLPQPGRTK
jgi:tetratricopeptide (TPR) repeat protein